MPPLTSLESDERLRALAARRWRIALTLTAVMIAIYFGFIALIAYDRPLLATLVAPGLTLGILLGALVIVVVVAADVRLRAMGEHALRSRAPRAGHVGA